MAGWMQTIKDNWVTKWVLILGATALAGVGTYYLMGNKPAEVVADYTTPSVATFQDKLETDYKADVIHAASDHEDAMKAHYALSPWKRPNFGLWGGPKPVVVQAVGETAAADARQQAVDAARDTGYSSYANYGVAGVGGLAVGGAAAYLASGNKTEGEPAVIDTPVDNTPTDAQKVAAAKREQKRQQAIKAQQIRDAAAAKKAADAKKIDPKTGKPIKPVKIDPKTGKPIKESGGLGWWWLLIILAVLAVFGAVFYFFCMSSDEEDLDECEEYGAEL
jgi:hypothetical protein